MEVFIGSSKEAVGVLDKVTGWVARAGLTALPWNKTALFSPGEFTWEQLTTLAKKVGAAVLIFTEDDKLWYRQSEVHVPRDNILIEYGLFCGSLGRERAIICVEGKPAIASDLAGLTVVDISPQREDEAQEEVETWARRLKRDESEQPKMLRAWRLRESIRPTLRHRADTAEKELFFVGFSLESTLEHQRSALLESIKKRGLRVRLLMCHPRAPHVEAHREFSGRDLPRRMQGVIKRMERLHSDLARPEFRELLEIRLTRYLPRFAARVFDAKTMIVNFYLFRRRAQENPSLEIRRDLHKREFVTVLRSLKRLWKLDSNHRLVHKGKWRPL